MRSYTTYDWMLASGLALKGLPLSLFAMTASYNRKGRRMYESRESLAGYLGYSERQVGKALQSLVSTELLVLRLTDGHREFRINIRFINEILEKKRSKNNRMADSFKAYLKSCDPFEEEEQSSSPEVKKVPQEREQSSPSGEKKVPEKEEQSSPNNIYDNILYNKTYNVLTTLSSQDFIELLFPIFFFKNNCNPKQEIERFVKFYKDRGWKLGGGKTMTSKEEIKKAAESWTVKGIQETGFRPSFMKGWREVYKIAPQQLKKDVLCVRTLSQGQLYATIKCSDELTKWLDKEKETVEAIFATIVHETYKLEWIKGD